MRSCQQVLSMRESIKMHTATRVSIVLVVAILQVGCHSQVVKSPSTATPSSPAPKRKETAPSVGSAPPDVPPVCDLLPVRPTQTSAHGSRKVTLSWNVSVPATQLPHDAVACYLVYRSSKAHDRDAKPINYTRVTGTTYIDPDVEPGVYYYATRAVSATGARSALSDEVRVEVRP